MNEINAAARLRVAANERAEGDKIMIVKAAVLTPSFPTFWLSSVPSIEAATLFVPAMSVLYFV